MNKKNRSRPAPWLQAALDYVPQWLEFQMARHRQPGCAVAIARDGELLAEYAFGSADLSRGCPLTPRHRMRIASHSKAFTATGVLLLREQGRVGLDDPIGRYVGGLHKGLSEARIGQLLSHGAGVTRDGDDSGQFQDRRPYLSRAELRADLARPQPMQPGLQLKYSNHGYGLLGLMIEELTGEDYAGWITRNVLAPSGLEETSPDMPQVPKGAPVAKGHSTEFPFERRLVIPGDNVCDAIAPAGGFVATAADVARFFAQLAPDAKHSVLGEASRREMMQRRWRDPWNTLESHYGLGTMISAPGAKEWFGHTGSLQGFLSRTSRFTASGCTVTVLCNALDAPSYLWVDSIESILEAFQRYGAPTARSAGWTGRWWNLWGAIDLVPMGKGVCQVAPAMNPPFDSANTELAITGKNVGRVERASAYHSPGQTVRLVRDKAGRARELWIGGSQLLPRDAWVAEVEGRYARAARPRRAAANGNPPKRGGRGRSAAK